MSDMREATERARAHRRPTGGGLARRLVERAAHERLVDVAYTTIESPVGPDAGGHPRGLVRISFGEGSTRRAWPT